MVGTLISQSNNKEASIDPSVQVAKIGIRRLLSCAVNTDSDRLDARARDGIESTVVSKQVQLTSV